MQIIQYQNTWKSVELLQGVTTETLCVTPPSKKKTKQNKTKKTKNKNKKTPGKIDCLLN